MGGIFANMHQLKLSIKGVDEPHYDLFSNDEWENLILQTRFEALKRLIPVIQQWNNTYQKAMPVLNENLVITHRDLHHTNVLWFDDRPRIIDWESAGFMNPTMEIVGYGLE
jgi:thiamine kinase-like enzyme